MKASRLESKAVKDAVWGMIGLTPREIALIDSPPFQRLRRVRQLGVTYLTYPTAGYSRFEHSLGAVHQISSMLRAISLRSGAEYDKQLSDMREAARLAALLHDIGHLPLSHVSETYFSPAECVEPGIYQELQELQDVFFNVLLVKPKLAEMLSVGVMTTPSFTELLDVAEYKEEEVAQAALAIVGRAPSLKGGFLPQLISSGVDADKLDYMFRDSLMAGAPVAVDLERLLFKLSAHDVPVSDLGPQFQRMASNPGTDLATTLAWDPAGDRSMYELSISRRLLFERVYLHHKTRAAQRVALRVLAIHGGRPAELLGVGDELFGPLGAELIPEASKEIEMLVQRDLPHRVFAVANDFLRDKHPKYGWDDLTAVLNSPHSREEFEVAVAENLARIRDLLGLPERVIRIWSEPRPRLPEMEESNFKVVTTDGTIRPSGDFADEASSYPNSSLSVSFIFATAPSRKREAVYLAVEYTLAKRFELYFNGFSAELAKVQADEIAQMKRDLLSKSPDFYAGLEPLLPADWHAGASLPPRRPVGGG